MYTIHFNLGYHPNIFNINITHYLHLYVYSYMKLGPFTRHLLSELTDTDLSPKNFPFFTFKELDVGSANGIRTMNLTHTGEYVFN